MRAMFIDTFAIGVAAAALFVMSTGAAGAASEVPAAAAPAAETAATAPTADEPVQRCGADLAAAVVLMDDGQSAADGGLWAEALKTYETARVRLGELVTRCSADVAAKASVAQMKLKGRVATAEAGMHRAVCVPAMDRALDLDSQAATLQAEKKEWSDIEKLFARAESTWQQAATVCQGSSRELALSNQADSARARAKAASFLGDGGACDRSMADAARMVDLAKTAWNERRWEDAGMWHRKAAMAWGAAAEKCTEPKRSQTLKRKESAVVDAHNALHCVPAWEAANTLSRTFKALPHDAAAVQRSDLHNQVELAWTHAAEQCRGSPQENARATAELFAKERGAAPLPVEAAAPAAARAVVQASVPVPVAAAAVVVATPVAAAAPVAVSLPVAAAPPSAPGGAPLPTAVKHLKVGGTVYSGQLQLDPHGGTVSGKGRVEWDNGDIFVGTLVAGKSAGEGTMIWKASGHRYEGQWKNDLQNGKGVTTFADGSRYEGDHLNGQCTGHGTYWYGSTGNRFEGEILDGQPNGKGSFVWKSGDRYEGDWKLGVRAGQGRFTWANGSYWEGRFENDVRTEDGKMVFASGT